MRYLAGSYLVLELTNHCNLACVHCAVYEDQQSEEGHPHYATKGYLDLELVDGLIADWIQEKVRFDALILFWLGEPLLHPDFSVIYQKLLRASVEHGIFAKIEVHSNTVLLDKEKRAVLLNSASVPQVFHCSLDATTRDTYQKIKGQDYFLQAQRNAQHLLSEKQEKGALYPRIVLQFIVGSNNMMEAQEFRDSWEEWGAERGIFLDCVAGHVPVGEQDYIFFRQLDCPDWETQQTENKVFADTMFELNLSFPAPALEVEAQTENLTPCSGFWKSPVIDWTGEVTVCTRDNELKNCLGRLQEHRFSELWWGTQNQGNREQVGKGCYDGLTLCQDCFVPRSLNHAGITEEEIAQYSEDVAQ